MYEIVIPGKCIPKGRPRFTHTGRTYTPRATKDYELWVRKYIRLAKVPKLKGALEVEIDIYRAFPAKFSQIKKEKALAGEVLPVTRPDLDNYVKSVLDASNGLLFEDDNQICTLKARKLYGNADKVILRARKLDGDAEAKKDA